MQRADSLRHSIRRAYAKARPFRVILVAWIAMPVPLFISDGWWIAPPWTGLIAVNELYADLESIALTILFAAGIVFQTTMWAVLAAILWLRVARSPQAGLAVTLAHPVTLWIYMVLLVHASLRPTYLIGDDVHRHWVTFSGLF